MAQNKKQTRYIRARERARKQAKLALVPHKANQFRPHLVRRWGILAVLLLVFVLQASYNYTLTGSVLGEDSNLTPEQLLVETNVARVQNGLGSLEANESLQKAAEEKAQDMLANQYWAHNSPDGIEPWTFIKNQNYKYATAGENLARNFSSSDTTVAAWLASPEHRANLLDDRYQDVGFAVVHGSLEGQNGPLVVALYGEPSQDGTVAGAVSPVNTIASVGALSPIARFGLAMQGLTPATIGSLVLMLFATVIALFAHIYRKKLPKRLQKTWYRHHGLIKSGGLVLLAVLMVIMYGGGDF